MWWLLACCLAHAGEIVVDAKVPVRLSLDGELVAELYAESRLVLPVGDGGHTLVVTTDGTPQSYQVTAGSTPVTVLVGRTGTSIGVPADSVSVHVERTIAGGPVDVRFRTVGRERLMIQLGQQRVVVPPGNGVLLPLDLGEHPLTVRSSDGTNVFARGVLTVSGAGVTAQGIGTAGEAVVQLAEGKIPETSGDAVAFDATGR